MEIVHVVFGDSLGGVDLSDHVGSRESIVPVFGACRYLVFSGTRTGNRQQHLATIIFKSRRPRHEFRPKTLQFKPVLVGPSAASLHLGRRLYFLHPGRICSLVDWFLEAAARLVE